MCSLKKGDVIERWRITLRSGQRAFGINVCGATIEPDKLQVMSQLEFIAATPSNVDDLRSDEGSGYVRPSKAIAMTRTSKRLISFFEGAHSTRARKATIQAIVKAALGVGLTTLSLGHSLSTFHVRRQYTYHRRNRQPEVVSLMSS